MTSLQQKYVINLKCPSCMNLRGAHKSNVEVAALFWGAGMWGRCTQLCEHHLALGTYGLLNPRWNASSLEPNGRTSLMRAELGCASWLALGLTCLPVGGLILFEDQVWGKAGTRAWQGPAGVGQVSWGDPTTGHHPLTAGHGGRACGDPQGSWVRPLAAGSILRGLTRQNEVNSWIGKTRKNNLSHASWWLLT